MPSASEAPDSKGQAAMAAPAPTIVPAPLPAVFTPPLGPAPSPDFRVCGRYSGKNPARKWLRVLYWEFTKCSMDTSPSRVLQAIDLLCHGAPARLLEATDELRDAVDRAWAWAATDDDLARVAVRLQAHFPGRPEDEPKDKDEGPSDPPSSALAELGSLRQRPSEPLEVYYHRACRLAEGLGGLAPPPGLEQQAHVSSASSYIVLGLVIERFVCGLQDEDLRCDAIRRGALACPSLPQALQVLAASLRARAPPVAGADGEWTAPPDWCGLLDGEAAGEAAAQPDGATVAFWHRLPSPLSQDDPGGMVLTLTHWHLVPNVVKRSLQGCDPVLGRDLRDLAAGALETYLGHFVPLRLAYLLLPRMRCNPLVWTQGRAGLGRLAPGHLTRALRMLIGNDVDSVAKITSAVYQIHVIQDPDEARDILEGLYPDCAHPFASGLFAQLFASDVSFCKRLAAHLEDQLGFYWELDYTRLLLGEPAQDADVLSSRGRRRALPREAGLVLYPDVQSASDRYSPLTPRVDVSLFPAAGHPPAAPESEPSRRPV